MKGKFSSALSLALIVSMLFTSIAFADNVQNDVTVGGNDTFTLGGSTTVYYRISATGAGNDGQAGCNAADATPATVTINVPSNVTANPASLVFTNCGVANAKSVVFTASVAGNYSITVSVSDLGTGTYTTNQAAFTLKVLAPSKTDPTITWVNPDDIVYGTALSGAQLNATASVPGTFVYTPSAGTVLDAGLGQTLSVNFTPDNTILYNAASKNVTINVLKADPGCSISGYTGTYDGAAHGAGGSCSGIGTLELGESFTDVPGDTAYWSFTGNANYNNDSGSVAITINAAPVTATAGGGTSTYDGSTKSPSDCVVSGAYKGDLSCVNNPASVGPDAGLYPISPVVTGTGLSNFAVTSVDGSYEIKKAATTTTVTCPANVTYNGFAQEPCTATVTGPGGLSMSLTVSYGDNLNAGTATASASYAESANYLGSSDSKTFTIDKAPVTATAGSGSSVFDGSAKSPSACVVSGAYTGDLTCANGPASVGPDAGTYPISPVVNGTGLGNFEVTSVDGSYTILKADPLCTVTGYNVIYDGFDHTATGACTGVLGETLSGLDLSGTTHKLVGNYTDTWVFTDVTGNYNNTSGTVNNVIQAWDLKGFYQPVDMGGVFNTVKGGSTVPLKFEIFAGVELTDTTYIQSLQAYQVACTASGTEDPIETVATGGTSLRYDWTSGQFIFNWKTPKSSGSCYKVTMTTLDGSSLSAYFRLK